MRKFITAIYLIFIPINIFTTSISLSNHPHNPFPIIGIIVAAIFSLLHPLFIFGMILKFENIWVWIPSLVFWILVVSNIIDYKFKKEIK